MGKLPMFGNKGGKISNKGFERFGGPCVNKAFGAIWTLFPKNLIKLEIWDHLLTSTLGAFQASQTLSMKHGFSL